jgi:hypothetical protein
MFKDSFDLDDILFVICGLCIALLLGYLTGTLFVSAYKYTDTVSTVNKQTGEEWFWKIKEIIYQSTDTVRFKTVNGKTVTIRGSSVEIE